MVLIDWGRRRHARSGRIAPIARTPARERDIEAIDTSRASTAPMWASRACVAAVVLVVAALVPPDTPASTLAPAATQAQGLVAAYSFDEGAGTAVGDTSGSGNAGVVSGATWAPGRFGQALTFDSAGDWVTVPDAASLDLTTGMTLEAWVNPSLLSLWRSVLMKEAPNYFVYSLYVNPNASGHAEAVIGGTSAIASGGPILPLDTWSHLASTYDGSTIRLYVNGSQVASASRGGAIGTSTGAFRIGGNSVWPDEFWSGRIDEVRIYNRALSAAEIQTDMATPVAPPPSDTTPPTVSVTSPTSASTVYHVTTVSAAAADNVSVAQVQFFADGVSIGTDISAPYRVEWNTTTRPNGAHSITAVARDTAGNQTTSASVSVSTINPAFVDEVVVPGITAATTIAFLPDGRMLVGELTETIWVVQPGSSQPSPVPFLVLDNSQLFGEQGLMDILIDPDFAQNGYYYIFYTRGSAGQQNHNRVSRFTASGNATVPGSEVVLWQDDVIAENEHHGGSLAWGADGKLYFTYGDQFIPETAQQLSSFRGKLLRINKDGSVPTDNPFYDGNGPNKDAIWALGLRNPFRMSIDPVTGTIYIGDVGGNSPRFRSKN